jgi:hypothetical protein
LIGGAAGFAVPFLHKKFARITPSQAFDPTTGTTILGVSGSL